MFLSFIAVCSKSLHSEDIPELSSFLSLTKLNVDLRKNVKNVIGLDNLRLSPEEVAKDSHDRQLAASALLLMDVNLSMIQFFTIFWSYLFAKKLQKIVKNLLALVSLSFSRWNINLFCPESSSTEEFSCIHWNHS